MLATLHMEAIYSKNCMRRTVVRGFTEYTGDAKEILPRLLRIRGSIIIIYGWLAIGR
jgi:hypothetical protein